MSISLPPTKKIRICNLDEIVTSETERRDLLMQPVEHIELILSYLNLSDLSSLGRVNGILYDFVTRSEICFKQILYKYCKLPLIKTESIYNVQIFNQNIASTLYESYYNFIADNLSLIKQIDSNFQLIDKKDIIPLNIYDLSQKRYFEQLRLVFDELGIWSDMVSIIFNPLHFNQFRLFNNTNIFKAYSRLLSYNFTSMFPENIRSKQGYALINIHKQMDKIIGRKLNYYEEMLFKTFHFDKLDESPLNYPESDVIVNDEIFLNRLKDEFGYLKWNNFIDWNEFWLIGGSVLKCILKKNWNEDNIDLDFFANNISYNEYVAAIKEFAKRCCHNGYKVLLTDLADNKQSVNNIYVHFKYDSYSSISECSKQEIDSILINNPNQWQKFQFVWYDSMKKAELMNIIDIDCCQIGFDGHSVLCTYGWIQAITTNTMISYKLVENCKDSQKYLDRILKYKQRGFQLIVPHSFNDEFMFEMIQFKIQRNNDDDDVEDDNKGNNDKQYECFMLNNDTMKVRNKFIDLCKRLKC